MKSQLRNHPLMWCFQKEGREPGVSLLVPPVCSSALLDMPMLLGMTANHSHIYIYYSPLTIKSVYQEYYQTNQLRHQSPSTISWLGSIQIFFLFGGTLFGGPLFDRYGAKVSHPFL